MKTFLACVMAVAGALALAVPHARATLNFTTQYDVLNITATIVTNIVKEPATNIEIQTAHAFTLDNAAILNLLEGPDWNNGPFPPGSKLVMSWDAWPHVYDGNLGDILVIDKTGTNVLYDASEASWSHSTSASMTVNFYSGQGAFNESRKNVYSVTPGYYEVTLFNTTSFQITDGETGLSLSVTGPSADVSRQEWKNLENGDFTSWSDSEHASTYGAGRNEVINGFPSATVSVKISASGHGPGGGGWFYYFRYPELY
jgi:hypothetical protein